MPNFYSGVATYTKLKSTLITWLNEVTRLGTSNQRDLFQRSVLHNLFWDRLQVPKR